MESKKQFWLAGEMVASAKQFNQQLAWRSCGRSYTPALLYSSGACLNLSDLPLAKEQNAREMFLIQSCKFLGYKVEENRKQIEENRH